MHLYCIVNASDVTPEALGMERVERPRAAHTVAKAAVSQSMGCSSEGTAANGTRWSVPCLWARASCILTQ